MGHEGRSVEVVARESSKLDGMKPFPNACSTGNTSPLGTDRQILCRRITELLVEAS